MLQHVTSQSLSAEYLLRALTSHPNRPHLMLDCSTVEADSVLPCLMQWGSRPMLRWTLPGPLTLPRRRSGTLLIEGLHFMNLTQQVALLDWLSADRHAVQIISLTSRVIDALVAKGDFLEGLFNRLNDVRLDLQPHVPADVAV